MEIFMKAGENINSIEHIFALYGFLSSSQKFSRSLRSLDCILPVRKLGMQRDYTTSVILSHIFCFVILDSQLPKYIKIRVKSHKSPE